MEERKKVKEEIESVEKPYTLNLDKTLPLNNQSENTVERLSFGCSKQSLGAEDAVDHHEVWSKYQNVTKVKWKITSKDYRNETRMKQLKEGRAEVFLYL